VKRKYNSRHVCDRSPEGLAQLQADYQNSGLTQRHYAQQLGMGYSTLTKWLGKARQMAKPSQPPSHFVAVQTGPLMPVGHYHLRWPGGVCLQLERGFDPQEVRLLLSLLPSCSP
jgi:hypothetical protein